MINRKRTHKDVTDIQSLIEDDDDVKVKIGMYSVTVEDAPEVIESSTNVYINDDDVTVEDDTDNVIETDDKEDEKKILAQEHHLFR